MDDRLTTTDPLTSKGHEIMSAMKSQYGSEKGEEVFYASANKGTITGVHDAAAAAPTMMANALARNVERMTKMPDPLGPGEKVAPRSALEVGY